MPDELTGLLNRAEFVDHVDARTRRHGSVAVIVCDLDDMKPVNGALGHAGGDRVLREVGKRIAACAGPQSAVARLGGDEFAVALLAVDAIEALRVGQAIADSVVGSPIVTSDPPYQCSEGEYEASGAAAPARWAPLCRFYGPLSDGTYVVGFGSAPPAAPLADVLEPPFPVSALHISISVGLAVSDERPHILEELLRAAHDAAYTAKRSHGGRALLSAWRLPGSRSLPTDWVSIARRNARSVQTTIGWIFWDPGAVERFERLGLPGPLGYIASRAAPLAPIGPDATIAAFGSISPAAIRVAFDLVAQHTTFDAVWSARNEAVVDGLHEYAPAIREPLADLGPVLWPIIETLPSVGRVLFAAHLRMPRTDDPVLSGWHAVNCVREWRGDAHWALIAAAGLDGVEASILHNAWLGYEKDWLAKSRGSDPETIERAWTSLEARGLARAGQVSAEGIALRQKIEDDTDRLSALLWQQLGAAAARRFAEDFEPPCEALLRRVDITAGPNYQPASRLR